MIRNILRAGAGGLLLGLPIALASCSSASIHAPGPIRTHAVVSHSASPAQSPSQPPAQAHQAAVIAAARAFFTAMDLALRTGQTEEMYRTSTSGCNCRALIAFIVSMHHKGRVVDAGATVSEVYLSSLAADESDVEVRVDTRPYQVLDPQDNLISHGNHEMAHYIVRLVPVAGAWLVQELVRVSA
jgi:hypothetical protein